MFAAGFADVAIVLTMLQCRNHVAVDCQAIVATATTNCCRIHNG
jgi:hypothetical protein